MSRSQKFFLGILTFLPFILFAIYIAFFITLFFDFFRQPQVLEDHEFFFANFYPVAAIGLLMALSSLGLLIYYIIHAVNNKQIDSSERLIWILVFIFAGMIGFPIYWYMRIWKQTTPQSLQFETPQSL